MNEESLLTRIRSRAYWRVEIRPTQYSSRLPDRSTMENALKASVVSFRGWPYPYYEQRDISYNGKWLEGNVEWDSYKEHWRFYKSGQWVHYLAAHGAWIPREVLFQGRSPLPKLHPGYINVRDILFTLTEIHRFAVGVSEQGVLVPQAFISIQLHGTVDYMLYETDGRFFPYQYVNTSAPVISREKTIATSDLRAESDKNAMDLATEIYSVFGWIPAAQAIRQLTEDQKKLIERKL